MSISTEQALAARKLAYNIWHQAHKDCREAEHVANFAYQANEDANAVRRRARVVLDRADVVWKEARAMDEADKHREDAFTTEEKT